MNSYAKMILVVTVGFSDEAVIAATSIWKPVGIELPGWVTIPITVIFLLHHAKKQIENTAIKAVGL